MGIHEIGGKEMLIPHPTSQLQISLINPILVSYWLVLAPSECCQLQPDWQVSKSGG